MTYKADNSQTLHQPTIAQVTVLNTRPLPMGEELDELLSAHNVNCLSFPTIENQALPSPNIHNHNNKQSPSTSTANVDIIRELLDSPVASWIFISKSSVQFMAEFIQQQNIRFRPSGKIVGVGRTTKAELLTINDNLNVLIPTSANSESLLAMPELNECNRIVLVKGVGGRGLITKHFTEQNKSVVELDLYQRQPRIYSESNVESWLQADIILATSVDIAQATINNIVQLSECNRQALLQTKTWLVLSERIKQFLITQSITEQNIFVCEQSDNSSIIKMIKKLAK